MKVKEEGVRKGRRQQRRQQRRWLYLNRIDAAQFAEKSRFSACNVTFNYNLEEYNTPNLTGITHQALSLSCNNLEKPDSLVASSPPPLYHGWGGFPR